MSPASAPLLEAALNSTKDVHNKPNESGASSKPLLSCNVQQANLWQPLVEGSLAAKQERKRGGEKKRIFSRFLVIRNFIRASID